MHAWYDIVRPGDFEQLGDLPEQFNPDYLISDLMNRMTGVVKGILVEGDYIDKDYRSTYYHFYSKQGARYERECLRLHFFSADPGYLNAAKGFRLSAQDVQAAYLGYMVLRPIRLYASTIGRTVLRPAATMNTRGQMVNSSFVVHLLGYKLTIEGFPWMNQHSDISVCAHTACWSILRHNSNRYRKYAEFLTHDVTRMAHSHDPGGLYPSNGLSLAEAELVFRNGGTFPLTIARDVQEPDETEPFFRQLHAYIESGFPVYAHMDSQTHAIALMGQRLGSAPQSGAGSAFAWDHLEAFLAVDDNHLPYIEVGKGVLLGQVNYSTDDINAVVVPLPDKIFLPASSVQDFAERLAANPIVFSFPRPGDLVIRYFVTTSASLKKYLRDHIKEFDEDLVEVIMSLPMAQFVWIVEYSSRNEWACGEVAVRAVLDASASLWDTSPAWTIFDKSTAWVFNRNDPRLGTGSLKLSSTSKAYTRMTTNLHAF